jgi:hypothetical protein
LGAAGSIFGPAGTAIGATVGAVAGLIITYNVGEAVPSLSRKPKAELIDEWQQEHPGETWPPGAESDHDNALADGGEDHGRNVTPRPNDEHVKCRVGQALAYRSEAWVPLDKSEGVVKTQNSRAVFFSPLVVQSWWRTEAL